MTWNEWMLIAALVPIALFIEFGIEPIVSMLVRLYYTRKLKRLAEKYSPKEEE